MRLTRGRHGLRLVTTQTGTDLTDLMERYAGRRVEELRREELCGYVLKKDSPSCGMERVKVYARRPPGADRRGSSPPG
jgi:uncharacterized protein YbbK (DUF523 family)